MREIADFHRDHSGPESQGYDKQLGFLFRNLIEQKKFNEAEQIVPNGWLCASRKSPIWMRRTLGRYF